MYSKERNGFQVNLDHTVAGDPFITVTYRSPNDNIKQLVSSGFDYSPLVRYSILILHEEDAITYSLTCFVCGFRLKAGFSRSDSELSQLVSSYDMPNQLAETFNYKMSVEKANHCPHILTFLFGVQDYVADSEDFQLKVLVPLGLRRSAYDVENRERIIQWHPEKDYIAGYNI